MTATLHAFAPAKINLFLHILGRNPNGYHRLQTIFQLLSFGDDLQFTPLPNEKIELISQNCHFPMEDNLVYRAAKLLQQQYQVKQGVSIYLDKKLPSGAGLGGGSSDAGATLRSLNQLWQLNVSTPELIRLGASLGADIPIFVLNQNAWAEGIGEQLTPLKLPKQYYVILNPRCEVSTRLILQHPDLPRNTAAITCEDYSFANTHNDCEALVCKLFPEIAKAKAWLDQFGPARLTGTGGCLFLPVASQAEAETIKQQAPANWDLVVCHSLE